MSAEGHPVPARQFAGVDDWRLVIEGQPNDAAVGHVRVGDIRVLVHRIDEQDAELAGHRAGRCGTAQPAHSYAGLRDYVAYLNDDPHPGGAT